MGVWHFYMNLRKRVIAFALTLFLISVNILSIAIKAKAAELDVSAPSVILIEASTGQTIYENNSTERRSPASITKIMTLLITFEQLEAGKIRLDDKVVTSAYASSMGGSQVFLADGETQTLETLIKCITVASGNDASVAVAEYIAGTEAAFVGLMNEKAEALGMTETHFEDCCGLTDSDDHYSCARDVAIMSRELTTKYPQVFDYTQIWMEDITHETKQGTTNFTLNSTNKLLKQYQWTTGLKTGSTSKAQFCISATASRDGIDLIAVVMGSPTGTERFQDAQTLLSYGFNVSKLYIDENQDTLRPLVVEGGVAEEVPVQYLGEFRYLDTAGSQLDQMEKVIDLPKSAKAPLEQGTVAGYARYLLDGTEVGNVPILYSESVDKAGYRDYLKKAWSYFLL